MPFDLMSHDESALEACHRRGALFELGHKKPMPGTVRRMWMRPKQAEDLYGKDNADPTHWAAPQVQALVQRYINHEKMIIASSSSKVHVMSDFKVLEAEGPPVFEIRFRIEPHKPEHLRIFGLFVATNCFVVTAMSEKGKDSRGRTVSINVGAEVNRCYRLAKEFGISHPNLSVEDVMTNFRRL